MGILRMGKQLRMLRLEKKSQIWHTTLELDWLYTAPGRQRQMGTRSEFYERNKFSNNDKMSSYEGSWAP